jgi:hypothetical protein
MKPIQSPIQWVLGALSLGIKQLGHEADYLPLLVLRLRRHRAISPLSKYNFMV